MSFAPTLLATRSICVSEDSKRIKKVSLEKNCLLKLN